jgi:hypothetical protein
MSWADAIANNILRVEGGMLIVSTLTLGFLIWYAIETFKLRKTAEEQIRMSENLLHAAMEQAEGIARPCITLASKLRDREETINEVYGVKAISVVKDYKGFLAVRNVGNGLALNISYQFNRVDDPNYPKGLKGDDSYLQRLHAEREIRLPIPVTMMKLGEWQVVFEFESLGGRKYRTTVRVQANVLSGIRFEQISGPTRVISASQNSGKMPDRTP